jgi:hypothetical protein
VHVTAVPQAKIASPAMDSEPEMSASDQSQFCFGRLVSWLDAVSAAVALSLLRCFGTYGEAIDPSGWVADVEQAREGARDTP